MNARLVIDGPLPADRRSLIRLTEIVFEGDEQAAPLMVHGLGEAAAQEFDMAAGEGLPMLVWIRREPST